MLAVAILRCREGGWWGLSSATLGYLSLVCFILGGWSCLAWLGYRDHHTAGACSWVLGG